MGRGQGADCQEGGVRRGEAHGGLTSPTLAKALGVPYYSRDTARVNPKAVSRIAQEMSEGEGFGDFHPSSWDAPLFWNGQQSPAERAQYYAIGNAINFRFWELVGDEGATKLKRSSGVIGGEKYGGAMYMWRALKRTLDEGALPLLSASFLRNLSRKDFDEIFTDDEGNNPLSVGAEERIANLRDLGEGLTQHYDGQFLNVAKESGNSLIDFARLSGQFRAFDDPVYKLTMLNAIMLSGSDVHPFADEPLPAIDYHLVRHAVRQGMVVPEPSLERKLKEGELLEAEEAQGLRQACLDAYLQLAKETGLSGEVLDNKYWHNRNICTDPPACIDPQAEKPCPFEAACEQHTSFGLPLEITRYY